SREFVLRIPGMTEARANVRAAADSAVERAKAAAAAQKALQQRTNEAARARQRNVPKAGEQNAANKNSMSYEASQQAQALAEEQSALAERMQNLQENAKQIEKQLKQSGALDSALSARLQEAQKLLRDA